MNYPAIHIHIILHCFTLFNCLSLVKFSKIKGRNVRKMWSSQDVIDGLSRTKTFCCEKISG